MRLSSKTRSQRLPVPCPMFSMQEAQLSSSNCDYFLLGKSIPNTSILFPFYSKETDAYSFSNFMKAVVTPGPH